MGDTYAQNSYRGHQGRLRTQIEGVSGSVDPVFRTHTGAVVFHSGTIIASSEVNFLVGTCERAAPAGY